MRMVLWRALLPLRVLPWRAFHCGRRRFHVGGVLQFSFVAGSDTHRIQKLVNYFRFLLFHKANLGFGRGFSLFLCL